MNETIEEMVVRLSKNTWLDRRIGGVNPDGTWKWQYRCKCGVWCWEDQCFCSKCGLQVGKTNGDFYKVSS